MKQNILIATAYSSKELPDSDKLELAICGRSNTGKSSLINTLFNMKNLAHTSSRPGKTKSLNFYIFNNSKTLVDLPGFGYARVSLDEKDKWRAFIEEYIYSRAQLHGIIILLDIRRGIQVEEQVFIEDLFKINRFQICLVFTKIDKLSKNELAIKKREVLENINNRWQSIKDVFFTSSLKKIGIEELKEYIIRA